MITYEMRRAKMQKPGDEDEQLRLAKQYAKRLRNEAKNMGSLAEKLAQNEKVKEAESIVRQIRHNIWDIEEELIQNQTAQQA